MTADGEQLDLPGHALSLRPETDADEAFLRDLYADTRASEMALVPWDDTTKATFLRQQFDAQRSHYRRQYPNATFDMLLQDGVPIGRLYLDRGMEAWRLLDIAIVPDRRGVGLGTALMRGLLAEAASVDLPVHLYVEAFNPARRLYDRLGFLPLSDNGVYIIMRWHS